METRDISWMWGFCFLCGLSTLCAYGVLAGLPPIWVRTMHHCYCYYYYCYYYCYCYCYCYCFCFCCTQTQTQLHHTHTFLASTT
jgi:hypothetical protein